MSYPEIGSKYTGPALDRPTLRQMPRHWQLEVRERTAGDTAVLIACALAALFAVLSVGLGW